MTIIHASSLSIKIVGRYSNTRTIGINPHNPRVIGKHWKILRHFMPGRRATRGKEGANNSPSSQPAQIPFDNHKIRSILMPRMIRGVRQIESLDNTT